MAEPNEWICSANEAIIISLVTRNPDQELISFSPKFTYSIFGDEERIFGYKDLQIEILFAVHHLHPHVDISWSEKFKTVGETEAVDVKAALQDFLPAEAFVGSREAYLARVSDVKDMPKFRPPGAVVKTYTRAGRRFEIWCAELSARAGPNNPSAIELIQNMQILVSLFIEAGTPIYLDDPIWTIARWRVFFVYEVVASTSGSPYHFAGYSTSYRFLTYEPSDKTFDTTSPKLIASGKHLSFGLPAQDPISISSVPCRSRISQFLILPPHQKMSHGTHLYNAMVDTFLADPATIEITVEDPSEAFDDLRDYCDFARLRSTGALNRIKFNTVLDPKTSSKRIGVRVPSSKLLDKPLLHSIRKQHKIAQRQFDRLVEIYLLSKISKSARTGGTMRLTQRGRASDPDDRAYYYWRLLVKQRIYKKNKDILFQLDRLDRIDKLEETMAGQQDDYERLLEAMGSNPATEEAEMVDTGRAKTERRSGGKRKMVDEDEDEDEDEDDGDADMLNVKQSGERKRNKSVEIL
ncbi:histone acetyltransferase 1 [Agyrium rufum]|nr:histone acetyltransferase 1 [Agyrium rufum]